MKKLLLLFILVFLVFLACKQKHKKSKKIVIKTNISSTGELIINKYFDKNKDSCIVYWPNGRIKEKGILINHYKRGWWKYYDSLGNLLVKSYEIFNEKGDFFEQKIFYLKNGQIDSTKSSFLHIDISDTLLIGKRYKASVQLVSNNQNKKLRIVCLKMLSRQNFSYDFKDSICSVDRKSKLIFEILPEKVGKYTLKGYVTEKFQDTVIYHKNNLATLHFFVLKYNIAKPVVVVDSL